MMEGGRHRSEARGSHDDFTLRLHREAVFLRIVVDA
jgi:hypothetical protein